MCNFPEEFTCVSGSCVNIHRRCDNIKDCDDGSDEEECSLLKVPSGYDKSAAPKLGDSVKIKKANEISTSVEIINFDFVDTISMVIGLTVEIRFQWKDPNIDFEDAKNDEISEFRIIPDNEKEKIWQPFYHTVYDNAVIGETIKEEFYTLGVIIESNPKERVASAPKESLIYPGAHNPLVATQKMKMKYRCDFFVRNYPFDSQTCDFFISIVTNGNNTIKLTNDDNSVTYDGPLILDEFAINGMDSTTNNSKGRT